jgi:hypothetical protein
VGVIVGRKVYIFLLLVSKLFLSRIKSVASKRKQGHTRASTAVISGQAHELPVDNEPRSGVVMGEALRMARRRA